MMLAKFCCFIPGVSFASSVIKQFVNGFKEGVRRQKESSRAEMEAAVKELFAGTRKNCKLRPYTVRCIRPGTGSKITIQWQAFDKEMAAKYAALNLGAGWLALDEAEDNERLV